MRRSSRNLKFTPLFAAYYSLAFKAKFTADLDIFTLLFKKFANYKIKIVKSQSAEIKNTFSFFSVSCASKFYKEK